MAEKEYIERGAALKALRYYYGCSVEVECDPDCPVTECAEGRIIMTLPAADVVEVVHGEWVVTKTEFGWNSAEYPTEYTCSVCGRTERQTEPYCHCGAKMDGERKEL